MVKEGRIPCRCLLREAGQEAVAASVEEYIALLPEPEKAGAGLYRARLRVCETCDELRDGTCALCGCYVEARAAKKHQTCPAIPDKWL